MAELFSYKAEKQPAPEPPSGSPDLRLATVFLCLLAGFLLPLALLVSFNYFNDRNAVFHEDRPSMATSYLSLVRANTKQLVKNGDRHRTILFGSSRANAIDLQRHVDPTAYTFSTYGGYLDVYLAVLQTLIDNNVVPDTVILSVGEASIDNMAEFDASKHRAFELRNPLADLSPLQIARRHLLYMPNKNDYRLFRTRLTNWINGDDEQLRRTLQTGRAYCYECEEDAARRSATEQDAFLREKLLGWPSTEASDADRQRGVANGLTTVEKFVSLAREHDIALFIFVDAVYQELFWETEFRYWVDFKRQLAQVSPYLDFNTLDPAYAEPTSFYDPVHYNEAMGDRLATDIAQALNGNQDALTLGVWVTPETVDTQLRELQRRYEQLRPE